MKTSFLELYVKSFLKTHRPTSLPKVALQRAAVLVKQKLNVDGFSCCDDEVDSVDLITSANHYFLRGFEQILTSTTRENNIHSLNRVLTLLENRINGICC